MKGPLTDKAFAFAVRIVRLYKYSYGQATGATLFRQLLRSGTSVGANLAEASDAQSDADFISKLSISLKEARESQYWLRLLHAAGELEASAFESLHHDCEEVLRLLTSTILTKKKNIKAQASAPTRNQ